MPIIIIPSGGPTTLWDEFYPLIVAHAPQCPYPEVMNMARKACREFFQTTAIWKSRAASLQTTSVPLLTTVAGTQLYEYSVPAGADLNRVHVAWVGTTEVLVDQLGDEEGDAPSDTSTEWRIAADGPTTLRLSPVPQVSGVAVLGTVSYLPSPGATGIPKPVFDLYKHEIAAGAVAWLIGQPQKPWTNPGAVRYHRDIFDEAVMQASNDSGPVRRTPLRVTAW